MAKQIFFLGESLVAFSGKNEAVQFGGLDIAVFSFKKEETRQPMHVESVYIAMDISGSTVCKRRIHW